MDVEFIKLKYFNFINSNMKRGEVMLEVQIEFDDIKICNIEEEDLFKIQKWMEKDNVFLDEERDIVELKERFLESYVSDCEFFSKIERNNELIGILKGRLEFKNPNELWIWFFYLDEIYKSTDLGSIIIEELTNYFSEEYGIDMFFTRIIKDNGDNITFWKNIGFKAIRMVKDFYKINGRYMDMLIMKKTGL